MNEYIVGLVSALWLGILTSISPCPLATNVAAISFVGKRMSRASSVLLAGLLYSVGRMVVYVVIAAIVVAGALSIPGISYFLQKYSNKILGPLLILSGMFLLDLISIRMPNWIPIQWAGKKAERGGIFSPAILGGLFALAFCPVSAALYFGSLIPLSLKHNSILLMPSLYGLGTGLPVLMFAFVIALGISSIGKAFNAVTIFDRWARKVSGVVFIAVGIYFTVNYIFRVP